MSPSYSTKNGIRYRFYVSSALLRGRKAAAGSVARVAAAEIEGALLAALKTHQQADASDATDVLERVVVARSRLLITMASGDLPRQEIVIPWTAQPKNARPAIDGDGSAKDARNESLIQSVVRAHAWTQSLQDGAYGSIEELADANSIHPKVIRQNLRLAFLSSEVTTAILDGGQPASLSLARIPKLLSLKWTDHRSLLGEGARQRDYLTFIESAS
jgi:hypothetical protein